MAATHTRGLWPVIAAFMAVNVGSPWAPPGVAFSTTDGAPMVTQPAACLAARASDLEHAPAIVAAPPAPIDRAPVIGEPPRAAPLVADRCLLGPHLARAPPPAAGLVNRQPSA
jgi:hypothetical protein